MQKHTKMVLCTTILLLLELPFMATAVIDVYGKEVNGSNAVDKEKALRLLALQLQQRKPFLAGWFFKEAEKSTITGTIVAHSGSIMVVVDNKGVRFNVILSMRWNIGSNVLTLNQVFSEGYLSVGHEVTINALKRTATNSKGVTVTIIFGYEVLDKANNNHLYAIQPLNIQN